jgi:hypothetical protein
VKFRKKPVVIDAQQWFEPGHVSHDPAMLTVRRGNTVSPPDYRQVGDLYCAMPEGRYGLGGNAVYMIRTLEGDMKVSHGDWVITGVKGEKYARKPDIFEQTYEPVVESV